MWVEQFSIEFLNLPFPAAADQFDKKCSTKSQIRSINCILHTQSLFAKSLPGDIKSHLS